MSYIQFAGKNHRADLLCVLALWHELNREWHLESEDGFCNMRQRATKDSLYLYLRSARWPDVEERYAQRACGFEIVLRLASGYIDTMHGTDAFFNDVENRRWFTKIPRHTQNNAHNEVALTPGSRDVWASTAASSRDTAIAEARRLLESDIESVGGIVALLPRARTSDPRIALQFSVNDEPPAQIDGRSRHLAGFVKNIHETAFQPAYRKQPLNKPVRGWDQRLLAYFWPDPGQTYDSTCANTDEFGAVARELAEVLQQQCRPWNPAEQQRAVELANAIFKWGGVPQEPATVTSENIERVFRAAIDNDAGAKAMMNSGWTKVSAFATAFLEHSAGGRPQVIWDSRVAASITSGLDAQLSAEDCPADLFPGVGTVPGRGGTRPRMLTGSWPSGYGTWKGQVSGSEVVREIRDILNDPANLYPRMPLPGGEGGTWTTRGVEMVLFMDGY